MPDNFADLTQAFITVVAALMVLGMFGMLCLFIAQMIASRRRPSK